MNNELAFDKSQNPNPWYYEMQELGLNYRASDIHCALGLSQLKKLEKFISKRIKLFKLYTKHLESFSPTIIPVKNNLALYIGGMGAAKKNFHTELGVINYEPNFFIKSCI